MRVCTMLESLIIVANMKFTLEHQYSKSRVRQHIFNKHVLGVTLYWD